MSRLAVASEQSWRHVITTDTERGSSVLTFLRVGERERWQAAAQDIRIGVSVETSGLFPGLLDSKFPEKSHLFGKMTQGWSFVDEILWFRESRNEPVTVLQA